MKLEDKFFKSFFFLFFAGIFINTLVVVVFLGVFTNNFFNKRVINDIINIKKKYSKTNINSVNVLLATTIQKVQAGLNENILMYQRLSNKLLEKNETLELKDSNMKCALNISFYACFFEYDDTSNYAIWVLDEQTTEDNLNSREDAKKQLIAFSNIIPNMKASLEATKPNSHGYSFYFEQNELYIFFPVIDLCDTVSIFEIISPPYSHYRKRCVDNDGELYFVYKFKCELP